MKYFDAHSHLNFPEYEQDRVEVLARLQEKEIGTITVGTDFETSRTAVELAEKEDNIWACIGVHPVDNPSRIFEKEKFAELVKSPRVVAIGECGMDFFHASKGDDYDRQKKLFLEQIEFAFEHDKPIMIHARNAYEEILEILEPLKKEHGEKLQGNIHFFAGSREVAKRFINIGFTLSFTGVITFVRDYDEVIKSVPLENILSETDSPYVAPMPHRGKRNEPTYVTEVAHRIAEIRNEDIEVVKKALISNVSRLFKIRV